MLNLFKKFFDFCGKENKRKFYSSIVLGTIQALLEALRIPAIAVMLSGIIEGSITSKLILESFLIMLISIIGSSIVKYKSTMLQTEAGYTTAANKRIEIAEHLRYLPMGYFNKNSLGYITSVTTNTMENLGDVATRVVMLTTQGILTTAVITIMLLFFDWRVGLLVVVGIILFFIVNTCLQKVNMKIAPEKVKRDTNLVERIMEYIQGMAEVKGYNLVGKTSKRLMETIDAHSDFNFVMEKKCIIFISLQGIITKLMGVLICVQSIYYYLSGSMDLLICIMMIICSFMLYSALESGGAFSSLLRVVDVSVDKAKEILDLPTMDMSGKEIQAKNHNMDVENISFSYDQRKIIDGISIQIPEKTTTAIVGPSGGGKTTLCHLISRFWDVSDGCIKLGNEDVKNYSMDSLMSNFSFVFQNVYLFQDTIANNIRFCHPEAPMEEVIAAAKKACCHDFIMQLENGYETVIGEGGASLSGGEKQRISIARAIMKDAPIIILDEATANVDPENEKDLMEAVDALTKEKTILMIAHRLKTVRNADQILVVDHGKIVQQGKHEELIKQEGIYKTFVDSRNQAIGWKI